MTHRKVKPWILVFLVFVGIALPHSKAIGDSEPKSPVEIEQVTKVTGELRLQSKIEVEAKNLSKYLNQPGKSAEEFVLYLDGRPIKGLKPRLIDTDTLIFDIERTDASKDEWNHLLGSPKGSTRDVKVSIGYKDENPVLDSFEYQLVLISKAGFWIFIVFVVVVLVLFLWLVKNESIIRDSCAKLKTAEMTYSLARTQMAFWFFIVVVSYVFIWMVTGDLDTLTGSTLVLIGISTATTLGSAFVDSSKAKEAESKLRNLKKEETELSSELAETDGQIKANPTNLELIREKAEKKGRLAQIPEDVKELSKAMKPLKSEGFIKDILTDVNGVSLHRFQIVIWTIVLGFIFLVSIYRSLSLPEFSETLLGLMGISSGTYIGFKFPEKQAL